MDPLIADLEAVIVLFSKGSGDCNMAVPASRLLILGDFKKKAAIKKAGSFLTLPLLLEQ
jgi:hypothetical protein